MRFNKLERIGVQKFSLFVTEELGWIVREQSIVDVGIDIVIEEVVNGNPTASILNVQIKSGDSHFQYNKKGNIVYYITNIHYEYWINFSSPVILILYSQKNKCFYWGHISKRNVRRTIKRWKIEIDKNNLLTKDTISSFKQILRSNKKTKGLNNREKFSLEEGLMMNFYNDQLIRAIKRITSATKDYDTSLKTVTSDLNADKKVEASKIKLAILLNIFSMRMDNEIKIYSYSFIQLINSCKNLLIYYYLASNGERDLVTVIPNSMNDYIKGFQTAIERGNERMNVIRLFPKDNKKLNEAKLIILNSYEDAIQEFKDAIVLCEELVIFSNKFMKK